MTDKTILVFLSRPNPFLYEQSEFLNRLKEMLLTYGIETITLQADNYDLTDSINYLKGMIKQCYGIIVVGFKQIYIDKGTKKLGAVNNPNFFESVAEDISGQAITSPFCHIEGTIGILNDLPLLIINEMGIREEGILKGGRFSVKVQSFNLSCIDEFFNDSIVKQQISVWVGQVSDNYLFLNLRKT